MTQPQSAHFLGHQASPPNSQQHQYIHRTMKRNRWKLELDGRMRTWKSRWCHGWSNPAAALLTAAASKIKPSPATKQIIDSVSPLLVIRPVGGCSEKLVVRRSKSSASGPRHATSACRRRTGRGAHLFTSTHRSPVEPSGRSRVSGSHDDAHAVIWQRLWCRQSPFKYQVRPVRCSQTPNPPVWDHITSSCPPQPRRGCSQAEKLRVFPLCARGSRSGGAALPPGRPIRGRDAGRSAHNGVGEEGTQVR